MISLAIVRIIIYLIAGWLAIRLNWYYILAAFIFALLANASVYSPELRPFLEVFRTGAAILFLVHVIKRR